jgi:hypothetical protein
MAAFQAEGVNANKKPGINDDYPLAQQGQVTAPDGSTYYDGADIPFMEALAATPGLMATFSGHDASILLRLFSLCSYFIGLSCGIVSSQI